MSELWRVCLRGDRWMIVSRSLNAEGRPALIVRLCRIVPLAAGAATLAPLVLEYDRFPATAAQVAAARATFVRRGLL